MSFAWAFFQKMLHHAFSRDDADENAIVIDDGHEVLVDDRAIEVFDLTIAIDRFGDAGSRDVGDFVGG